jgi:molybdopterin molybdotransferase
LTRPATLAEALSFFAATFPAVVARESVPIEASCGRRLAEGVLAPADLPRFDFAAMDGFALRTADLAPDRPSRLRIAGTVAAGHPPTRALFRGEASRICTGAMLPAGAERVVVQELCTEVGGEVVVAPSNGPKEHIRHRAEDVRHGEIVLWAGQRIGAAQLALLHALQVRAVTVHCRLRVALLSVGDELRDGRSELRPGEVVDSNRPMLRAMLEAAGCAVQDLGLLPDDPDRIVAVLIAAAQENDLVVTSGGASAGVTDHLRRLIARRGCLEFWRLALRPGRPVGFGDIDDCPILALPGNPMAAAVAFVLLGRPLVARLSGDPAADPGPTVLPLARTIRKAEGCTEVLAGRPELHDGARMAAPLPVRRPASLTALAAAEGLIVLPLEAATLARGDRVDFVPL